MDILSSKTDRCITFVPRTTENNFVSIEPGQGCNSYVIFTNLLIFKLIKIISIKLQGWNDRW
jgi:hypothetical protein